MYNSILVAASNSTDRAKGKADFICSGKNDELTIQKAIDECKSKNTNMYLFNGTYYIDDFYDREDGGPKCAICVPICRRTILIAGESRACLKDGSGVNFYVTESALESVSEQVDVIRTEWTPRGLGNGSALTIENISINLFHNQKPVRCIDLRRCDLPELKCMTLRAFAGMNAELGKPPAVPSKGCIGITMTDGSNHSYSHYTDINVTGFYEGFQVGGECVLMSNCGAVMCYYGHTFGNYEINCGANHPITIINGKDERNVNLPLFNKCGDSDGKGGRLQGNQGVTMISFHMERIAEQSPGGKLGDLMREVHPGTWKGNIDFTLQPAWCHTNSVDFQLWENDGSGTGFKTRNNCHKQLCSTEERLSYYPTLGQQIFDTDLNKMVVCINPEKREWVDFNGEKVDYGV